MRRWLRALVDRGKQSVDLGVSLVSHWLTTGLWLVSSNYLALARQAFGNNAVVYACLRLLSQSVIEPPLGAYQERRDGTEDTPLDREHPLPRLIRRPNELMGEAEFWELVTLQISIAGASYWWKQRNNGGAIIALWPLRPDRIAPVYSTSSAAGERVLWGWNYSVPGSGETLPIPRRDLLVFGYPDPAGETGGIIEFIGPLQVLAREISADNEATSFVGAMLSNYATPSLLIKTKTPIRDKDTAERIKRQMMSQLGGAHRGEPALLDADTEVEKLSFDLTQLEFPDLRAISESRIAAAFGTPAILVGLKVGLDRSTFANMSEAREFFAETTLSSLWRRFSDQYTNDVAAEFGDGLVCRFDTSTVKALAAQRIQQAQPIKEAFAAGAVTLNEYRQRVLSLDPLDGGDVLYVPSNVTLTPIADLNKPPEPPAPIVLPAPATPPMLPPGEQEPAANQADPMAPPAKAVKARDVSQANVERLADATHERRVAAFAADLTDALDQLRADVVRRYRARAKDDDDLVTESAAKPIADALETHWKLIMADAYADVAAMLDVDLDFDLQSPNIRRVLNEVTIGRYPEMTNYTRDQVRTLVARGIEQGWGLERIAGALDLAEVFGEARAMTIARTETAVAYNRASLLGYRESGVVEQVKVHDGRDYDEPCKAADGQTWTLEKANANVIGHPRCRRGFGPIVKL